jgi:hypothetical protein
MQQQYEQTAASPAVLPGSLIPVVNTGTDEQEHEVPVLTDCNADAAPGPETDITATSMDGAPSEPDAATDADCGTAENDKQTADTDEGTSVNADAVEDLPELDLPIHPACAVFPMMSEDRLTALVKDIEKNGLVNPVVIYDGQIVDGRHRYIACQRIGTKPRTIDWREIYPGSMSLYDWIWSMNGARRHLTQDQIAIIHAQLRKLSKREEARARQIKAAREQGEHGSDGGRGNKKALPVNSPEGVTATGESAPEDPKRDHSGETREVLAREIGVSGYKMQQALNVSDADAALAKAVANGDLPLREADKRVKAKRKSGGVAAAAKPKRKDAKADAKARKPSINIADTVNDIMSRVDKVLIAASDEDRKAFLKELMTVLSSRR